MPEDMRIRISREEERDGCPVSVVAFRGAAGFRPSVRIERQPGHSSQGFPGVFTLQTLTTADNRWEHYRLLKGAQGGR